MPTHKINLRLLSLNQLEQLTGIGYRQLKKKLAKVDPEEQDGRTLLFNSIDALTAIYYGTDEVGSEDEGGEVDPNDPDGPKKRAIDVRWETARNVQLKNLHAEFDLEVKKGEFISKREAETWLTNKILGFKARLRILSQTLTPELVGQSEKQIEEILNKGHDEALSEMAIDDDAQDAEGDNDEGSEEASSTAEADDIPVG